MSSRFYELLDALGCEYRRLEVRLESLCKDNYDPHNGVLQAREADPHNVCDVDTEEHLFVHNMSDSMAPASTRKTCNSKVEIGKGFVQKSSWNDDDDDIAIATSLDSRAITPVLGNASYGLLAAGSSSDKMPAFAAHEPSKEGHSVSFSVSNSATEIPHLAVSDEVQHMPATQDVPSFLQLRELWASSLVECVASKIHVRPAKAVPDNPKSKWSLSRTQQIMKAGDRRTGSSCFQYLVTTPTSHSRIIWDVLSGLVLTYDLVAVPLMAFGWYSDMPPEMITVNLVTTGFWSVDMFVSCFQGFYVRGYLEMRPFRTTLHYVKSWFALDFSVNFVDWLMLFMYSDRSVFMFDALRSGKSAMRSVRSLRVLRMARLLRLVTTLSAYQELLTDNLQTAMGVFKFLSLILFVNHCIACLWYALGTQVPLGGQNTWVKDLEAREGTDLTVGYRYATSLHWSLTQFTPASMEVLPRNLMERVFAIVVLILGFVMFSSLISSITNTMTKHREGKMRQLRQRENLLKYLSDNKVSLSLGNQVIIALKHQDFSLNQNLHESDIGVLKRLPEFLRKDLHHEVYSKFLVQHPFYYHLDELYEDALISLCHTAMSEVAALDGQEVFAFGEKGNRMLFVRAGKFDYHHGTHYQKQPHILQEKDYLCEGALWMEWEHRGRLVGHMDGELVMLDSTRFQVIIRRSPLLINCRTYAREFRLEMLKCADSKCISDLWTDFDKALELAQKSFNVDTMASMSLGVKPMFRRAHKKS